MAEQGAPELELLRYASDGTDDEVSRATQQRQIDSMSVRLHWTVGRAGLPYGVSVGRLHASDVLPRVRFDAAEAEAEEGLAFAEVGGPGRGENARTFSLAHPFPPLGRRSALASRCTSSSASCS